MNITKTNKIGLLIAKKGFVGEGKKKHFNQLEPSHENITVNANLLRHNPKSKIIRVSKGIMDTCKLIDIESIKENIDESNFDIRSMFILLDNDNSGIIKVERFGSDISFLMMSNLSLFRHEGINATYNSYSFIAKSFQIENDDERMGIFKVGKELLNYKNSVFVVQLLTYLIFGEITEKNLIPKSRINIGSTRFLNNSKLNITFCDSLWKQRINVDGFKVRGHFRLQACGEEWKKRKLIWIEEFEKQGYNRKATVELLNQES